MLDKHTGEHMAAIGIAGKASNSVTFLEVPRSFIMRLTSTNF